MENKKLVPPSSGSTDGDDATTWALPEGAVARLGQGRVEALAFSPDGHYLKIKQLFETKRIFITQHALRQRLL